MNNLLRILLTCSLYFCTNTLQSSSFEFVDSSYSIQSLRNNTLLSQKLEKKNKTLQEPNWNVESYLHLIIIAIAKGVAVPHIPNDISRLILLFCIHEFEKFEKQKEERKITNSCYKQSFVDATDKLKDKLLECHLDNIIFHICYIPNVSLFIDRPKQLTSLKLTFCKLDNIKIWGGILDSLIIKNSNINTLDLVGCVLYKNLCFENTVIKELRLHARIHKGFYIGERKIIIKNCYIEDQFYLNTSNYQGHYYSHYIVEATNVRLGPRCKVLIDPSVKIISLGSTFLNASSFAKNFSNYQKSCCCYGCCACIDGYFRLWAKIWDRMICKKDYSHPAYCTKDGSTARCITYCTRTFLCLPVCIILPCAIMPKICKSYVNLCFRPLRHSSDAYS